MKKIISIIAMFGIILLIFSGCQTNPSKNVIISKNDGSFEEKLNQTLPTSEDKQGEIKETLQWKDTFTSTDGSVSFIMDISEGITRDTKQVIEVTHHSLTGEDIQRVAKALLDDVAFYERRPSLNPQYSKSQYQKMIGRLAPLTNQDTLNELMGADTYKEYIEEYIALWTTKMETASETDPRVPCDWVLKKESKNA